MSAAGIETVTVDRGDTTLAVTMRAGTPTVLLLHGLAGHGGEWAGVRHFLPDDFGVIMPDQRGHGASYQGPTLDVDAQRWVDDAVACIDVSDADRVTVVGQSMGSLVATRLAASRPDLVEHLVLIEGGMAAMTDEGFDGLSRWFESWPSAFATRREAIEFFGADERSTKAWVDGLASGNDGLIARFDAAAMLATMRELAGADSWDLWSHVTVPTTVMRASSSAIADDDIEQMIADRPDVEVVTIAGGHDLHLDEPEIVAGVIERAAQR